MPIAGIEPGCSNPQDQEGCPLSAIWQAFREKCPRLGGLLDRNPRGLTRGKFYHELPSSGIKNRIIGVLGKR